MSYNKCYKLHLNIAYKQATGKLNVKHEPRPGALSAATCPP
jgi:hypothetical protein